MFEPSINTVSIVIDLHMIFEEELELVRRASDRRSNIEEDEISVTLCEDAWDALCVYALECLFPQDGCEPSEQFELAAMEATNLLFHHFDNTQFFDLTEGTIRAYINTLNRPYALEDCVGDHLGSVVYDRVLAFALTCVNRIYHEALYPIFQHQSLEVHSVEPLAFLRHHFKLTVELPS